MNRSLQINRHSRWLGMAALTLVAISQPAANLPNFERIIQTAQQRYGARAVQTVNQWQDLIQAVQSQPEAEQVRRINEFFNRRIAYGEDIEIWKQNDFWATPLETMGRGAGDCEDYSIAKYFSLRFLGVPNQKLRITYVKAKIGGLNSDITQAHMVLGYYPDPAAEPLILDNLITDLRPASRRPDLSPVFSFNSEGLWVGDAAQTNPAGSATARLSRWRDLIARMQAEGFE